MPLRLANSLGTAADLGRYNKVLTACLQGARYTALLAAIRARDYASRCLRIFDSKLGEDIELIRAASRIEVYESAGEAT